MTMPRREPLDLLCPDEFWGQRQRAAFAEALELAHLLGRRSVSIELVAAFLDRGAARLAADVDGEGGAA